MKRLVVHLILIIALASSCSQNPDPTKLVYTEIFSGKISKTWKVKTIAFKNLGDPDWTIGNSCWSDERYTFFRDSERKFTLKSGSSLCDPDEEPLDISDTWAFSAASASLYFIFPLIADVALPYTVKEIDRKEMILEIYFDDLGSQSYQMVFEVVSEE